MKRLLLLSAILVAPSFATLTTIDYMDIFWNKADPFLVGKNWDFQIKNVKLEVDPATGTFKATLNFNYGANTLTKYTTSNGVEIQAADLFFTQAGVIKYGIPLAAHNATLNGKNIANNVDPGDIYNVLNVNNGTYISNELMPSGTPANQYGVDRYAWLTSGAGISSFAAGTVVNTYNYPSNQSCASATCNPAEWTSIINISSSGGTWTSFLNGVAARTIVPYFTDSTCGNDLLTVPEPSTYVMLSSALALLLLRRRKKS